MWSALHEVTHETLVGRPWVRPHLVSLFDDLVGSMDIDTDITGTWQEDLADPARLEARLSEGGAFAGLFSGPVQEEQVDEIQTFIVMVEGYGSYITDRAAAGLLPDIASVRAAMSTRHRNQYRHPGLGGLFEIESTAGGYGRGAAFCAEVAARWGYDAVHRIWDRGDNLPSSRELEDATGWAARVLLEDPFAG